MTDIINKQTKQNNKNNRKMKKLRITNISDVKTSRDDRNYRTVTFQEVPEEGMLSNSKERTRNLWEKGPFDSPGDSLYRHLDRQKALIEAGQPGALVYGSIETVEVEKFFIPSENGKDVNQDGEVGNYAHKFTSVVFSDETIAGIARSQKRVIKGEKPSTNVYQEELEEELVAQVE